MHLEPPLLNKKAPHRDRLREGQWLDNVIIFRGGGLATEIKKGTIC
jgi:hypothetical protein